MICSFYVMRNKDIYYYYYLILFLISRLHCRKSLFNVFGMKPSLGCHERHRNFPATNSVDTDTRL